jgi:hypothetical protein
MSRFTRQPLSMRGGHGELGITLRELEQMVAHAKELEYDLDRTRICSSLDRPKGLIDVYFVEAEWPSQSPKPPE